MRDDSLGRGAELVWAGQCGAGQDKCEAGRVDAGRYGTVTGGWGGGMGRSIAGQKQKKNPRTVVKEKQGRLRFFVVVVTGKNTLIPVR
jgi:hypothetical protein